MWELRGGTAPRRGEVFFRTRERDIAHVDGVLRGYRAQWHEGGDHTSHPFFSHACRGDVCADMSSSLGPPPFPIPPDPAPLSPSPLTLPPLPPQVEVICASMSSSLGSIGGFVAGEVDVVQVGFGV